MHAELNSRYKNPPNPHLKKADFSMFFYLWMLDTFLSTSQQPQRGFDLIIISFKSSSVIRYDSHKNTWKEAWIEKKKNKKQKA